MPTSSSVGNVDGSDAERPDDESSSRNLLADMSAEVEAAAARSRWYMAGISLAYAALLAVVLSRSWFLSDDLENFGLVRDQGLSWSYLRLNVFGHFAPAHRFLDWLVFHFWPLDWAAPALLLSAMLIGTAWTLHGIVRFLAPTKSWPTLLLLPFAASPLVLATAIWWAAAAHSVPAMLCGSLATLAALRFEAKPRFTDGALYTASLLAGLLFYEKMAVVPLGILALLWVRRFEGSHAFADLVAILRRCRALIGATVVMLAAFAIVIRIGEYDSGVPTPSVSTWWHWFVRLVTAGPFVGATGVSPNDYHGEARSTLLVLSGVFIVGVIAYSLLRFRGAWRAWLYLAVAFLPGVTLTAYGRAASFGAGIASDFHYAPELAPAVVIAVTLAFTRPRRRARAVQVKRPYRSDVIVALVLVPILIMSLVSDLRAVKNFGGDSTHRFFTNFERSSKTFDVSATSRYRIVNTDVPFGIVPPAFEPFNQISRLLGLMPSTRQLRDDLDPGAPLLMVVPDGTMKRARLQPVGELVADAGACLPPSELEIPTSSPPGDDRTTLFAIIEGVPVPTSVVVTTRANNGATRVQPVQGSADGRPVRLWASQSGTLRVAALPDACVSRFVLLRPEPIGGVGPGT